ncbi:ligand-binding sensor domain-containing diguanylate cyclase [Rheinheimera salexigens]|nr:ligand-binding sensor domain-containing diguanylate cyclase [Rheinheimera salexigens]
MTLEQDDYLYRYWSVEAGLPQISVTSIAQDTQGYVWVGTQNGLARFDGVNFRVFNTANTPSFSSNLITALYIDQQQRLWIGTVYGLMLYQDRKFVYLDNLPLPGGVNSIMQHADGTIYVGADHLYQWDEQLEKLQQVTTHQGAAFALHQQQDTLFIGGQNGFATLKQEQYQWFAVPDHIAELQVVQLARQADDLYLGTSLGLYRWQNEQWHTVTLPGYAAGKRVGMLYLDPQQKLWVASYDMLYQIDQRQVVTAEQIQGQSKDFTWIEAMLQDKFGNLWLGSHTRGLKRLRTTSMQRFSTKQGLTDPFVWSIQPWQQHLLVGTNDGLALLQDDKFQALSANKNLPNPLVYSMLLDSQSKLWVGTRGGLSQLDGNTLAWQQNYDSISHLLVSTLVEENERIWVGTSDGLYYLEHNKLQQDQVPIALHDARIRILLLDSQQRLWVGTENGLFLRDGDSFAELKNMPLSGSFISALKQLPDGNIFIGSLDQGFVLGSLESWNWFTQNQGLPDNGALYVEQVNDQLVISSFQGFYRLNYSELTMGNIRQVYMLLDDRRPEAVTDSLRCCNGAGSSKGALHEGKLWFPTLDGVLALPIQQLMQYDAIPKPVLESLIVGSKRYLASQVRLEPNQRDWQFRFTAPFFVQPSSMHFRYQLQGYDTDWVDAGSRRAAFYTNLPPGQYRFVVQVRLASDYRWSDTVSMEVQLAPHWYETSTARAIALLTFMLLLWAIYRWRLMALANAKQQLETLVKERTAELHLANQKLLEMSRQDALTGLNNRHYLNANISRIISRAKRNHAPLIWALLDLDYFKQVNDSLGHQVGDEVLVIIADLLRKNSRSTDHLIRWGGEEFLILLENNEDALLVIKRIHKAISDYPWQDKVNLKQPLTCSIGAVAQLDEWDWQHSLRLADQALFWVKEHGRNAYMILDISSPPTTEILAESINVGQLLTEGKLHVISNKDYTADPL